MSHPQGADDVWSSAFARIVFWPIDTLAAAIGRVDRWRRRRAKR